MSGVRVIFWWSGVSNYVGSIQKLARLFKKWGAFNFVGGVWLEFDWSLIGVD